MTAKHVTAAAAGLLLLGAFNTDLAAQTTCNAPLGWWESQGLEPVFIIQSRPALPTAISRSGRGRRSCTG